MTPPLILGDRAAEEMLERRDCGIPRYFVATMTMVGISAPIRVKSRTTGVSPWGKTLVFGDQRKP